MEKQYAGMMQAGNSYTATELQPPQPPLNSLYEATKLLNETALFVRNTADRLCGCQPETIDKDSGEASLSYFDQLDEIASNIRSFAARISSDMNRIQNRL